ncbi:Uncharacterised protein [uncultured archaeon]|nr:Uncharacterised protein [uncultured archaeon]
MKTKFSCDDGFMVEGEENEVRLAAYIHMAMNHPELGISQDDMKQHMQNM